MVSVTHGNGAVSVEQASLGCGAMNQTKREQGTPDGLSAEFIISEADYLKAMKLFARMTPKVWGVLGALFVVIALAVLLGTNSVRGVAIGGGIGGAIALVMCRVASPVLARRHYRNYPAIKAPIRIRLQDDGVMMISADSRYLLKWQNIIKWRHNDEYVLLYTMPRLFYIVPRRLTDSGFDIAGLMAWLEGKVGPPR